MKTERDFSDDPKFKIAMARTVYYGPIYLRRQSEPYLTLSLAGPTAEHGVLVAEVNLKLIQGLVSSTKIGDRGVAYVLDGQDQVVAHPEPSLVHRQVSALAHVKAARAGSRAVHVTHDVNGREVLVASAPIPRLDWLAIVELPVEEANTLGK